MQYAFGGARTADDDTTAQQACTVSARKDLIHRDSETGESRRCGLPETGRLSNDASRDSDRDDTQET